MLTPEGQKTVEEKGLCGAEEGSMYLAAVRVTDKLWRVLGCGADELSAYSLDEIGHDSHSALRSMKKRSFDLFATWSSVQGEVELGKGAILKVAREVALLKYKTLLLVLDKKDGIFIADKAASLEACENLDSRNSSDIAIFSLAKS